MYRHRLAWLAHDESYNFVKFLTGAIPEENKNRLKHLKHIKEPKLGALPEAPKGGTLLRALRYSGAPPARGTEDESLKPILLYPLFSLNEG
jgi:hypothetical protein